MRKILIVLSGLAAALIATPAAAQQAWEICRGHYIIDNDTGRIVSRTRRCHVEGGFHRPRGFYQQGYGNYGGGWGGRYRGGWGY